MRRIRSHLTYANVMATIAVFLVLSGGTAVALSGTDTVQSDDLGPGSQVKAPDVAANAVNGTDVVDNSISGADVNESSLGLGAEPLRFVGDTGQPQFTSNGHCRWKNFDPNFAQASFRRDRLGFVHLLGVVDVDSVGTGDNACPGFPDSIGNYIIFVLPPGFRPEFREVHVTLTNGALGRVNIDTTGAVRIESPTTWPNAKSWVALDGISFRCVSGDSGCP
jgi:hypothetical protein